MRTSLIIKEIERLPIQKRMIVVEKTIKSIREADLKVQMKLAADKLYEDYNNDKELTAFKEIDFEGFYEAR